MQPGCTFEPRNLKAAGPGARGKPQAVKKRSRLT